MGRPWPEEETLQGEVISSSHIHGTGEHIRAIVDEVVHSLQHCPGAHGGGASCLVSILKVIQSKIRSKEDDKNPVNELQKYATYSNTAIVLTHINASQLVLDYGHQGGQQQQQGDMTMY